MKPTMEILTKFQKRNLQGSIGIYSVQKYKLATPQRTVLAKYILKISLKPWQPKPKTYIHQKSRPL